MLTLLITSFFVYDQKVIVSKGSNPIKIAFDAIYRPKWQAVLFMKTQNRKLFNYCALMILLLLVLKSSISKLLNL